jgi:carboxylesterase
MTLVMPGAEPFFFLGNRIGCLLTHGFTATPQEVREMGEYLHQQGYTVLGVRLSGHGTHWKDLARSQWTDWLASVEDGYHLLRNHCDQIVPIGLSTGSVLNLILATEIDFPAIVGMATPIELPSIPALKLLYPFLQPLSWLVPAYKKGKPDWRDPQALEARVQYDRYPLSAVKEFGKCVRALQQALPSVRSPLLLLHSKEDGFVLPDHSERIARAVSSDMVRLHFIENSNHVISSDAQRFEVFQLTAAFLEEVVTPQLTE